MNETRNIIVGLEIGEVQSQICYYDRKEKEPISISVKAGSNQYFFPTLLSKKPGQDIWHYGLEAEYFCAHEGEIRVPELLKICENEEGIQIDDVLVKPDKIMEYYLRGSLSLLGTAEPVRQIKAVMITLPKISGAIVRAVFAAGEAIGFSREQIWLQDYDESFYYYVMNHRKDNRNQKTACFIFEGNRVSFAKLAVDNKRKPVTAMVKHGISVELSQDAKERDEAFYQLISRTCGTDHYFGVYIVGEGYSQEWAVRSTGFLCRSQRHVFYGNNLYVKGACYAAKEKCDEGDMKGYLYLSSSLVKNNLVMEMQVNGSKKLCSLAEAGQNWYELHTEAELILDNRDDLEFMIMPMEGGAKTRCSMKLPGLPKRPNKTTRLRVSLSCEAENTCVITVEDLGFGEMFPSKGDIWTEKVSW